MVAISCSFGSHGEKGVFWVVMFLYSGNCVYVLIVEFRLYLSLSLLSLSLYYRTELVSNGKNVCCSSIQSQRNWICIVSYPRHRISFLTVRSVQESLGSTESASTTLASEGRIWEISEPSKPRLLNNPVESEKLDRTVLKRTINEQRKRTISGYHR